MTLKEIITSTRMAMVSVRNDTILPEEAKKEIIEGLKESIFLIEEIAIRASKQLEGRDEH